LGIHRFYWAGTCSSESASASATKTGWVIGGGVETALPGKLSFGVEYLYVKFGSISATSTNFTAFGVGYPTNVFSHSADLSSNIVRVRLNKQF
jgi:outer membrane immunogenic protein